MKIVKKLINLILLGVLVYSGSGFAQTLPVGTPILEDYYRRLQLLGKVDSTLSFSIRPLTAQALQKRDLYDPEEEGERYKSIIWSETGSGSLEVLPLIWQNQATSSYPYGWNDGPMIPSKGFQTYFSTGVAANYKFISIQLKPEVVYAQNSRYQGFTSDDPSAWQRYYNTIVNRTDLPQYFGNGAYSKVYWGQSSFRLNFHPISVGISTENLWWGPGIRNSLLMSNTAPGFPHITLNTTKPIRTPIGSFEAQIVSGYTKASGYDTVGIGYSQFYRSKEGLSKRYFQGFVATYQPKWLPGLSLGVIRSVIVNDNDLHKFKDYFPLFTSLAKVSSLNPETGQVEADQRADDGYFSIFGRWVIPDAKAEVYGEFGRNDAPWDSRDLTVEVEHTRAYVIGFRKLVDLNNRMGDLLEVGLELTQLETPKTGSIRTSHPWYTHYRVRNGYTNAGQVLGAGIGPGSNVQSLTLSWLRGIKRLGVQMERFVHNNDLYYGNYGLNDVWEFNDPRRNWVDLGIAFIGEWNYKHFMFSGKAQFIRALNYQYRLVENENPDLFWYFRPQDKWNAQIQLGAYYRF